MAGHSLNAAPAPVAPPLGVYLHSPFCRSKCSYCNFSSRPLRGEQELDTYGDALACEISRRAQGSAASVYFGGGTPSLSGPVRIGRQLDALARAMTIPDSLEITLEMNPADLTAHELEEYLRLGVNRLSLGVQSTNPTGLRLLGRRHDPQMAAHVIQTARQAGFQNLSCDFIYGYPGQTLQDFQTDLTTLLGWGPDHLSIYNLSVEPDTPLALKIQNQELEEPDEDGSADMYLWARETMFSHGFSQYELSNFAKPGKICKHNLIYWTDQPYLGLGASAHSYLQGMRQWNVQDPDVYITAVMQGKDTQDGCETLQGQARMAETLMLRLRLIEGVPMEEFNFIYGFGWEKPFEKAFSEMEELELLKKENNTWALTPKGMLLSNVVFRSIL